MEITHRMKALRVREERMAELETENAILHLQIAQLQNSLKMLLNRQAKNTVTDKCQECCFTKTKFLQLKRHVQELKQGIVHLQLQYATHQQLIYSNIGVATSVLVETLQKHNCCRSVEFADMQRKYELERARRKELHNELIELRGNIRVHCRVRPLLETDTDAPCIKCLDDETVAVNHTQATHLGPKICKKHFCFDRIHGPLDSQGTVFAEVKPLLTSLLDGYNVCLMAYGQTGSGKTHTILGDKAQAGVLPQASSELFRLIDEKGTDCEVTVTVVEIYNEQIQDLLSRKPGTSCHEVIVESNGDVEVTNLTERLVHTENELLSLVSEGIRCRTTHSTNVHEHSSRSHLIVTIHLTGPGEMSTASSASSLLNTTITPVSSTESVSQVLSPSRPRYMRHASRQQSSLEVLSSLSPIGSSHNYSPFHVKLQLVDLAGSECVGQSGVGGANLKEAQYINKSLCSLTDVLSALSEKRSHIPYRNSILTHLLQDSIGGHAKLLMFLCVSPSSQNVYESLRVLGFGMRTRQIQRAVLPPSTVSKFD